MTNFAHTTIETPWGPLHLDGNSKITCELGTYEEPVANAFSLPHISTCPGSTPACRAGCYVHGLEKNANETYQLYRQNETTVHAILMSGTRMLLAARLVASHLHEHAITRFRWHVSGDVFSSRYATWIRDVCAAAPDTQFWIYTRSHCTSVLDSLVMARNLTVNISADADNIDGAIEAADEYDLNLCYYARELHETLPARADVIFPDYALRGRELDRPTDHEWWKGLRATGALHKVCPADFFGQSERHRCGPCKKCL